VVLIHVLQGDDYVERFPQWYSNGEFLIQDGLLSSVVPVFFVMSGYLFFFNVSTFDKEIYHKKLRSRFRTLLIPYLLWNLLAEIHFSVKHLPFLSSFFPNIHEQPFTIPYLLSGFWALGDSSCPILYPFWYVRDLMVMVVLSPIFYFLIKKIGYGWIVILLALALINVPMPSGLGFMSMLFFSAGSLIAIKKLNVTCLSGLPLWLAAVVWCAFAYMDAVTRIPFWRSLSAITGVPVLISLGAYLLKFKDSTIYQSLTESTFFVFAIHVFILPYIRKIIFLCCHPANPLFSWVLLGLTWLLTVAASVAIYRFCRRFLPRMTKVLCGGR
jgi:hypothetical protein